MKAMGMKTKKFKITGFLFLLTYFVLVFFVISCAGVKNMRVLDEASNLIRNGRYNEAIVICNDVIDRSPGNTQAYILRGLAYYYKGDDDRAIADYTRAIEISPDYALAYHNRGIAFSHKGDYDRAIADYTRAVEINPDSDTFREALRNAQEMLNE